MSNILSLRQTVDCLEIQAELRLAELDQRERELAMAAEELCPPVLEMGISIGAERERERVLLLIAEQQHQLKRGGTNATVLTTLRRMVMEVDV
jgi:hypothetical protein